MGKEELFFPRIRVVETKNCGNVFWVENDCSGNVVVVVVVVDDDDEANRAALEGKEGSR